MSGTPYRRGNDYERRVADDLRGHGYTVWQTRGSKSAADLIAIKPWSVVLVQVKSGEKTMSDRQWNDLYALATHLRARPVLADRAGPAGRRIAYRELTGPHVPRSHDWPTVPFHVDELDHLARTATDEGIPT